MFRRGLSIWIRDRRYIPDVPARRGLRVELFKRRSLVPFVCFGRGFVRIESRTRHVSFYPSESLS